MARCMLDFSKKILWILITIWLSRKTAVSPRTPREKLVLVPNSTRLLAISPAAVSTFSNLDQVFRVVAQCLPESCSYVLVKYYFASKNILDKMMTAISSGIAWRQY